MDEQVRHLNWNLKPWSELTADELYRFSVLRIAVFVVEQNCPYQEFDLKDQASEHLWAEDASGKVIAYLRIVAPGTSYREPSIGRVATALEVRQNGLGLMLMARAMTAIENRYGPTAVRISAQSYLTAFYQKFGFQSTGLTYLEDGIPHTEMCYTP